MRKRCNGKTKVLCGRMDIHPRTGLFGSEQENKTLLSFLSSSPVLLRKKQSPLLSPKTPGQSFEGY